MNQDVIDAARDAFGRNGPGIVLGAVMHEGSTHPEPLVTLPLAMMNRHGLIAGATGTGKTKTLQLIAEQLSAAGVPVFLADVKGDVSGVAAAGAPHPKIDERVTATGYGWEPTGFPVEFLSLTGRQGAQLRATVSSFGPLLLSKVLGLNETQTSVLTLVFKYCDDKEYLLLDFEDLRSVLQYLTQDGAGELASYGGMSKQTVGVLLREMVELEAQGAGAFFGEPEFDLDDLLHVDRDGRGVISMLELSDTQDKPALFSTFMMWMLARLYNTLPEVGDLAQPKLVFFFDEAHLLFDGASKAFREQVEQVVRLVRSKGIGVFFVTQSPKDIPADILAQLGNRVQHALRAFTPDDEKALRAAARTFPRTPYYDIERELTSLGTGQALVTVLTPKGTPTPPFATMMVPPRGRMSPLAEAELKSALDRSPQVREYARAVDRESAREILAARATRAEADAPVEVPAAKRGRATKEPPSTLDKVLKSSMARSVVNVVARGIMGALLGTAVRRRRR
ncbi:MAG: helicase HerA-like domain-containing protein [Gemmatimonadales bacterium]